MEKKCCVFIENMFSSFFGKKKHEHTSSHRRHGHTSSHHNRESPYKNYFEVEENEKMVKYRRKGGTKMEESYSERDHNSGRRQEVTKKYDEKGKLYQINKKKRNDTNTGFTQTEDTINDDGKHTRTITRYDKEGRGLQQLTLKGTKRDDNFNEDFEKGEFQGPTDITHRSNLKRTEINYERDLDRGYPRTKKSGYGERHGDFSKEQDKELFTDSLFGKDEVRQAGMTSEEKDAQREGQAYRQRQYELKDREKKEREKLRGRKDKEVKQEIRDNQEGGRPSTTDPVDPKEAVKKEASGNVEEDIEEEDKPKEHIKSVKTREKLYSMGGDGFQGEDEDSYRPEEKHVHFRRRTETGELMERSERPSSDFKHSTFKGSNYHENSPDTYKKQTGETVSDRDKRSLNTDKDYKVKTNSSRLHNAVEEEKRGSKVRVREEGNDHAKKMSKLSPLYHSQTDLYDDKTRKHLKKRTYTAADGSDRHTYHSIDSRGKETPISQEEFEKEENAFENTPSDLDKDPQHPASLTTIPKTTTAESFAEFQKQENMDIPTSSEEEDLTSLNTESSVVGKAERNASKYESAMKETEDLYGEL